MLFKYFPNWNFQNDLFKDFLMLDLNHDILKIVEFWPFWEARENFLSAEKSAGIQKSVNKKWTISDF